MRKSIILILCIKISFAQGLLPAAYKLDFSNFDSTAYNGLKSNMISDIVPQQDNLVWLGSGSGLSVLRDSTSIFTLSNKADISPGPLTNITPQGGVVALTSYRKTLFAAFATSGEDITIGNGLIYSMMQLGIQLIGLTLSNQLIRR